MTKFKHNGIHKGLLSAALVAGALGVASGNALAMTGEHDTRTGLGPPDGRAVVLRDNPGAVAIVRGGSDPAAEPGSTDLITGPVVLPRDEFVH